MANRFVVTATGSDGTRSLKVTIPAEVCRALGIEAGDVFWVEADLADGGRRGVDGDDGQDGEDGAGAPVVVLRYVRTARADEAAARGFRRDVNGGSPR